MNHSRLERRILRCDYNGHVTAVNIAELKSRLSAYLQRVRAGEEIMIRDRDQPVAKLIPLLPSASTEELDLVASGDLLLPSHRLNAKKFWSIGARSPVKDPMFDAGRAVSQDREERDAGLLGH
jgi:prevent-host-death family protein